MIKLTPIRISIVILAALALSACTVGSLINIPNENPEAQFTASPTEGGEPLTVTFNAAISSDSDGTIVQYEWDYQGDGAFDVTSATPGTTHVYLGVPGTSSTPCCA